MNLLTGIIFLINTKVLFVNLTFFYFDYICVGLAYFYFLFWIWKTADIIKN